MSETPGRSEIEEQDGAGENLDVERLLIELVRSLAAEQVVAAKGTAEGGGSR